MGSLDIDSLFTDIHFEETIEICTNNLFKNSDIVHGLKKNEFKDLLSFVLFKSCSHLKRFQRYLNSCYVNMSFTIETEQNNKISFLDVNVIREQGKFITSVYRKPTFSGV